MSSASDSQNPSDNQSYGDDSLFAAQSSTLSVSIQPIQRGKEIASPVLSRAPQGGSRGADLVGEHPAGVLTREILAAFRRKCGIPNSVTLMVPSASQNPETVPTGWCCAYTGYFEKCGLSLPISTCLLEILQHLKLAFPQMFRTVCSGSYDSDPGGELIVQLRNPLSALSCKVQYLKQQRDFLPLTPSVISTLRESLLTGVNDWVS